MTNAIVLFSGGLDSVLAAKVLIEQGINVTGVNFVTEFSSIDIEAFKKNVMDIAEEINLKLKIIDISEGFLKIMKDPYYGFGGNLNPCVDCKILMLQKAKKIMQELGADFIATGEVIGERPMSQRRDTLNAIEKRSGLRGYLLRPLSAKLLIPTKAEEEGLIDRKKLFSMHGRSRKPQYELARKFGITRHFAPAGGCLLTEPAFAKRLQDLITHKEEDLENVRLLKVGRHFRLDEKTKAVIGRDDKDNEKILALKKNTDVIFYMKGIPGPVGLLRGDINDEHIKLAGELVAAHSKKRNDGEADIIYSVNDADEKKELTVRKIGKEKIEALRV